MKKLIIVMAMVLLTGCACSRAVSIVWVKDGVSEVQYKQELYECQKDAELYSYRTHAGHRGQGVAIVLIEQSKDRKNRNFWLQRCMESKGYLPQQVK